MPWHDVAVVIEGEVASDFGHHFVHLWNNAKLDKVGTRNKETESTLATRGKLANMFSKVFQRRG